MKISDNHVITINRDGKCIKLTVINMNIDYVTFLMNDKKYMVSRKAFLEYYSSFLSNKFNNHPKPTPSSAATQSTRREYLPIVRKPEKVVDYNDSCIGRQFLIIIIKPPSI